MSDFFKHDYISYDEFGLKEIRCMASGKVIGQRVERDSKRYPGKTTMQFQRHVDYREVPYLLKDNSVAFLIFCDSFREYEMDDNEIELVNDQIRRAKIAEMKNGGKTSEFIESVMANIDNKNVVRRLTDAEMAERFSNVILK